MGNLGGNFIKGCQKEATIGFGLVFDDLRRVQEIRVGYFEEVGVVPWLGIFTCLL